jgi:hypothetical protein
MSNLRVWGTAVAVLVLTGAAHMLRANPNDAVLAIVMTNDASANAIKVYDAQTKTELQTLSTRGQGGVGGNARGVRQFRGDLVAAVNNGSNSVAIYRRDGNGLKFDQLVSTTSPPVSVDFGNNHLYVAGSTTIDSFALNGNHVGWRDGTAFLEVDGGGSPANGSTAQVGVIDQRHVLVTLKTDPTPGTVDVVALDDAGAITGSLDQVVSAPMGTLTPFGFAVYPDGAAVITLAHSNQDGLFRNGVFTTVINAGQAAPCWMTRAGKYLFTANTGSKTISRLVGTGNNIFVDGLVAANVTAGGSPSDIDAEGGVLGVIDRGAGQAHLSLFTYNQFGELIGTGSAIGLGVPNANGVAILPAPVAGQ